LKKEALKEIGKGFINIGNGIIILTIVNGLFNFKLNTPLPIVGGVFLTILAYIVGSILLNKGADDE